MGFIHLLLHFPSISFFWKLRKLCAVELCRHVSLPSAAITDRGCTLLIARSNSFEIPSRTSAELQLETEADVHYTASLFWKPIVSRTDKPMMQKVCIKFSICHLHYWKKLRQRKGTKTSFVPQSTDDTANKQGGTEEHYYKMIPPLHPILENTYIRDSYRKSSGYTYAHTQINKHIIYLSENHVFYG